MREGMPRTDNAVSGWVSRWYSGRLSGWLCVLLAMIGGCKQAPAPAAAEERPATLVTSTLVTTRDVPVYLDEIGKCTAFQSVSVKPQVTGAINKIKFTDGRDVKRGQVL